MHTVYNYCCLTNTKILDKFSESRNSRSWTLQSGRGLHLKIFMRSHKRDLFARTAFIALILYLLKYKIKIELQVCSSRNRTVVRTDKINISFKAEKIFSVNTELIDIPAAHLKIFLSISNMQKYGGRMTIKPALKTVSLIAQKEKRAALRPITGPKKIKDLWDKAFAVENLRSIYYAKVKTDKSGNIKKSVGLDFVTNEQFQKELDENLAIIERKVKNGTYHFTRYKLILINKGPGKPPREIRIPTIRDRVVQGAMAEFARTVFGSQCEIPKGKNIIREIIKERPNFTGYSKNDISMFFKSISHELLKEKLEKKFKDQGIVELFMRAVATESFSEEFNVPKFEGYEWDRVGVPEGLSFSGFVANMFLEDIDLKYKAIPDIKYYRFVDDILILSSAENSERYSSMLRSDFAKLRLTINAEKASDSLKSMSFDYLGYVFDGDKITIRPKSVEKIERRLAELIKEEAKRRKKLSQDKKDQPDLTELFSLLNLKQKPFAERLNNLITGFKVNKVHYSWVNYYSLINDYTLMGKLDALVKNLLTRYGISDVNPKKHLKALLECQHNPEGKYIPDYTYIKSIVVNTGDEMVNFEVTSNLAKNIAKQLGWNRRSRTEDAYAAAIEINSFFEVAVYLAITEGFSFTKKGSKYYLNMKNFKIALQKGIMKLFTDSKEI